MPDYPYDVQLYNSSLKMEIIKLSMIAIVLILIFVYMIISSAIQIKRNKTKKTTWILLFATIAIGVFLSIPLVSQISLFTKDIKEETYIQYIGPATIREECQIIFGGIPTGYAEYIISFQQEGKYVELATRKDYGLNGGVEKLYIVYSQHSGFILEFLNE